MRVITSEISMPNWCGNTVTISGEGKQVEKVKEFVKGEESHFSFESIVPMPKELRGTNAPNMNMEHAQQMTEKYGYPDWYSWAHENWGTKWDLIEVYIVDGPEIVTYYFDTAWAPPIPVMEYLAPRFPDVKITIEYDEPGMDFWGTMTWTEGILTHDETGPSRENMNYLEEQLIEEFDEHEDVPDEDF